MLTLIKKNKAPFAIVLLLSAAIVFSNFSSESKNFAEDKHLEGTYKISSQLTAEPTDPAGASLLPDAVNERADITIVKKDLESLHSNESPEHTDECEESLKIAEKNLRELELDSEDESYAEKEIEKILLEAKKEHENFVYDKDGNPIDKSDVLAEFEAEINEFENDEQNVVHALSEEFIID